MYRIKETASFALTLFNVYKRTDEQPEPTFLYTARDGELRRLPFLQPEDDDSKAVRSALHRLQPLARRIFASDRRVFRTAPKELGDELRTIWHLGADCLPVRFTRVGGVCLEEDYLILYLEAQPDLPVIDTDCLARISVMMCNRLSSAGCLHGAEKKVDIPKSSLLIRERDADGEEVSRRLFQGNEELPLIQGILGETLTVEDIFATIAGPGRRSMLGDRFLLNSLLITPDEVSATKFSQEEQADLMRRARGMNASDLPPPPEELAGYVVPVRTFANVLFMAAEDGISGHVKPLLPVQDFLHDQFASGYRTEYLLLFVLAVYQHYRLADLIRECVERIERSCVEQEPRIKRLRQLRKDLVLHELKYIDTQPAFLNDYQQYYNGLRKGLNTDPLVVKLRRILKELDMLLAGEEQHRAEEEAAAKKNQKSREEKGKMWLAMTAESVALPYYLYNLLEHALHPFHIPAEWAWAVTIPVTVAVIFYTRRAMRGRIDSSS